MYIVILNRVVIARSIFGTSWKMERKIPVVIFKIKVLYRVVIFLTYTPEYRGIRSWRKKGGGGMKPPRNTETYSPFRDNRVKLVDIMQVMFLRAYCSTPELFYNTALCLSPASMYTDHAYPHRSEYINIWTYRRYITDGGSQNFQRFSFSPQNNPYFSTI